MNQKTILIGSKKLPMDYVMTLLNMFNSGTTQVVIKAGGKNISKAVDVEQILRNKFMKDVRTKEIRTGRDRVTFPANETQKERKIYSSSIEIVLEK